MYSAKDIVRNETRLTVGLSKEVATLIIRNHRCADLVKLTELPRQLLDSATYALRPYNGSHHCFFIVLEGSGETTILEGSFRARSDNPDWVDFLLTVGFQMKNGPKTDNHYHMSLRTKEVQQIVNIIEGFFSDKIE